MVVVVVVVVVAVVFVVTFKSRSEQRSRDTPVKFLSHESNMHSNWQIYSTEADFALECDKKHGPRTS